MRYLTAPRIILVLFAAFLFVVEAAPAHAGDGGRIDFTLAINGESGPVYCHLFASEEGFPMKLERSQVKVKAKVKSGTATCRFSKVKAGTYAMMAFHDLNANGKLDTNWMGIPREGVVSSNNAKGRMGPPSFKDASFVVADGASVKQSLSLKYY